ncbi:efflux RND transporter periplasmic adaptor subunit [Sinorhizobium sp. BG8]|uniref:efflux RND transporter periplasmic adaptor subunit n=1 Tax=Sinorhizobium sp. BG8 TaxID=2613773 RepID=UPI00193E77B6|nr:efflux RND transporter periplasmic adaptor subunit [Sinorhizobium sp. BG8]QRM54363.1 efflux RND transporter periplasmic adaptor subunit [Sinorhizobium sp. BG8]
MKFAGVVLAVVLAAAAGGAAVHWRWVDLDAIAPAAPATAAQPAKKAAPAVSVEVARAEEVSSTNDIEAIGTLQSDESVQLAPEVAGRIAAIRFNEGQAVKAGEVLVSLDNALAKASEEEIRVRLDLAVANYERAQRMAQNGTGTTRDLDTALAERNTATTLLNSQLVQLSKHDILAPFDGVVGLRNVSTGSYVPIGTTLVNLEKIDVLKVDFKVPEANLQQVRIGQSVEVTVDAFPGKRFTGTIYAIDPMVDVNGRAMSVRARLPNSDLALRPGLFARVMVKGLEERKAVAVPESAVVARGQDRFVWTVVDGKAQEAKITIGARRAGVAEVEGLPAGSTVVTAGHTRLRNGAAVDIVGGELAQAGS